MNDHTIPLSSVLCVLCVVLCFVGICCTALSMLRLRARYGLNPNDGTFLMGCYDWQEFYTHLFACVVFPSEKWSHDSVSGEWKGRSAGGCIKAGGDDSSWQNNPKFDVVLSLDDDGRQAKGDGATGSGDTNRCVRACACVRVWLVGGLAGWLSARLSMLPGL